MNKRDLVLFCAAGISAITALLTMPALAQEIKRCDGADGQVTYAETCPQGSTSRKVAASGRAATPSDANQRADEAAFQHRHMQRQNLEARERSAMRNAAAQERRTAIAEEKMRRQMALKEDAALRKVQQATNEKSAQTQKRVKKSKKKKSEE